MRGPRRPVSSSWPRGKCPPGGSCGPARMQGSIARQPRARTMAILLLKGIAAYNGYGGDPIDASRAGKIARAFQTPLCFARVHNGRVLRRCRILRGLRRPVLLPGLARNGGRLRVLPPRPRQEPRPVLVFFFFFFFFFFRYRMDPVYDSAYYEDLAGQLCGLVITFSGQAAARSGPVAASRDRRRRIRPGTGRPGRHDPLRQDHAHRPGTWRHRSPGPADENGFRLKLLTPRAKPDDVGGEAGQPSIQAPFPRYKMP